MGLDIVAGLDICICNMIASDGDIKKFLFTWLEKMKFRGGLFLSLGTDNETLRFSKKNDKWRWNDIVGMKDAYRFFFKVESWL